MEYLYVCLFSNGHIKVGRSIDPKSRIATHAERVACVGIELSDHFSVECAGSAGPAEAELIARCIEAAAARHQSEWFAGLEFIDVTSWATECATVENWAGAHLDWSLVLALGGPVKVAELLGWAKDGSVQRVQNWKYRGIPSLVKLERPDLFPYQRATEPATDRAA